MCVVTFPGGSGAGSEVRTKGAVYTAKALSASGFALLDNREEHLVVQGWVDLNQACARVREQARKLVSFITMKDAMTNGFSQSTEKVKCNLSLRA